ncbi:LamG-like jellyroll fold domain-containing protein [Siphonobacter curvatus]|uniref:PKD domain-containing protein n=1 Tax=Siphonobacter curvatus TaxID=2094562 RepID=A0A2S7IHB2_9BACT|nr:LamG-like jellyroll fold domain-containing protein [Siphonobacter curvatus]PQA55480.1 hypothetical protein C5O19_18840 [Siphonobacter curvatus]
MEKHLRRVTISFLKIYLFPLILLIVSCGKEKFPQRIFPKCEPITAQIVVANNQLKVDFSLNVNAADFDKVEWSFGDGGTASTFNPSYTYKEAKTFQVSVKLTNKCGDQATVTKSVTVVQDIVPSVATGGSSRVNNTTANVTFKLLNAGLPAANQYGICYSYTNSSPRIGTADTKSLSSVSAGDSTVIALSNLTPGVSYYYCSYIIDSKGEPHYGEVKKFQTTNADIWTGLVAYYDFNNVTGNQVLDLSGNNNAAIIRGTGATKDDDRQTNNEKVLVLDGGYLDIADNEKLRPNKISVSMWFKAASRLEAGTTMQLYYKSGYTEPVSEQYSAQLMAGTYPDITINADIKPYDGKEPCFDMGWKGVTNKQHQEITSWHHFVAVFDGPIAKTYLDGKLWGMNAIPGNGIRNCPGGNLRFGSGWRTYAYVFKGSMDDIRVYDNPLTEAQILELFKH